MTLTESSLSRNLTKCKTNSSSTTECDLMQSNSSLRILCTAEGSTPVTVQLVKDGTQLRSETNRIFHTDNNPQPGIYQCIATNKYGSHQTSIYVTISGTSFLIIFSCSHDKISIACLQIHQLPLLHLLYQSLQAQVHLINLQMEVAPYHQQELLSFVAPQINRLHHLLRLLGLYKLLKVVIVHSDQKLKSFH